MVVGCCSTNFLSSSFAIARLTTLDLKMKNYPLPHWIVDLKFQQTIHIWCKHPLKSKGLITINEQYELNFTNFFTNRIPVSRMARVMCQNQRVNSIIWDWLGKQRDKLTNPWRALGGTPITRSPQV